jgi:7-cyano-7-deazaguanine synthase
MDSAVLLDQLLGRGSRVVPFYVRTGCVWENCELAAVRRFLSALAQEGLAELNLLDMPLLDFHRDHWSMSGRHVPDENSSDDAVFMPGRNPLLLIKPALWCQARGIRRLALATLSSNPFADATPQFFAAFESMIHEATGDTVQIIRPFEQLTKHRVLELGRHLPLEHTFSCLAPVEGLHCGRCNKCAERQTAFRRLGLEDPTPYHGATTRLHRLPVDSTK